MITNLDEYEGAKMQVDILLSKSNLDDEDQERLDEHCANLDAYEYCVICNQN